MSTDDQETLPNILIAQ